VGLTFWPTASNASAEDIQVARSQTNQQISVLLARAERFWIKCDVSKPFKVTICQNNVEAEESRLKTAQNRADTRRIEQEATDGIVRLRDSF
jgi:hypothetical protein